MNNTCTPSPFSGASFGMPELSLANTLGAALIGTVVSAMVFGITNLQVYLYFNQFKDDWAVHKFSVLLLWLLDAAQISLTVHFIYHYAINEWGIVTGLAQIVWSFKLQFVFTIAILLLVQTFYTVRLWRISDGRYLLPSIVTITVLGGYAVGIVLAWKIYSLNSLLDIPTIKVFSYIGFGATAFVDLVIAFCFWLYFRTHDVSPSTTRSVVSRVTLYMVSTGLLTGLISVAALLLFILFPQSLIFVAVELLVGKLYVNSFLAMLNARKNLRNIGSERWGRGIGSMSFSNTQITHPRYSSNGKSSFSPTSATAAFGSVPWSANLPEGQHGLELKTSSDHDYYATHFAS